MSDFLRYAVHNYKSEPRGAVLYLGQYGYSFHWEHTEILSKHIKAKVDQLNLVFVILKLVLVVGKLYVYVFVCLNSVYFNSVTSHCWKHVQVFCGI